MKVIPPVAISPSFSSVAEPDVSVGELVWVANTSYGIGALRIRPNTHRKYECMVAVADTVATPPESDPAHWRDAGPTNKYAMFDLTSSVGTVIAGAPLVVEFEPGRRINSIGLLGMNGAEVRIEEEVGGDLVYDETAGLLLRNTTTWLQYYYGTFRVRPGLARFNLPMSAGAKVRITIQPTGGSARCGAVVVGMAEDLGTIVDQPTSDQLSLSKINRDEIEGITTFVKRRTVPQTAHRVVAPAARLDRLRELRDELDAAPALFSGADDRESSNFFNTLLVLGFARKWSISMKAMSIVSEIQLEAL